MQITEFPGTQAKLYLHNTQEGFDDYPYRNSDKIWHFVNKVQSKESLINRISIWKEARGVSMVQIFFNNYECEQVEKKLSPFIKGPASGFFKYDDFCELLTSDSESILSLLTLVNKVHTYVNTESRIVMKSILNILGSQKGRL